MLTEQILLQLIVILLVIQLAGFLCRLIGQQWVIGEIIAGLLLGPSFLGLFLPGLKLQLFPENTLPTLQTLGDVGLMLYMFSLGTRLDTDVMLRQSRTAVSVSLGGIIIPFSLGALLGVLLYAHLAGPHANPFSFSLFLGSAMAITAFPVLARLLTEKNMLGTAIGTLALACASIDDVIAWLLLAFVTATVHMQGLTSVVISIGGTLLFIAAMLFGIGPLFRFAIRRISSQHVQIILSIILLLLAAYSTSAIGIHPVFGAFLAGVIMPRNSLYIEQMTNLDKINNLLFLPIFFVFSGLRTQIGLIQSPALWFICLIIFVVACSGKVLGGTLCMRIMGKSWQPAFSLGVLMNTRGLVELIVLNIGYELGVLSPTIFAMLVIMAILTTMMTSPLLSVLGYRSA